jgi:uncharacterized protein
MAADGRVFVDTWGWLVLSDGRDPAFEAVLALRREAAARGGAWVTTDYVLDETITRLFTTKPFSRAAKFIEGIFEASRAGAIDIEHITPEWFSEAWKVRVRYREKPRVSFTDLTSFVVMRELGVRRVITGDRHFEPAGLGFIVVP